MGRIPRLDTTRRLLIVAADVTGVFIAIHAYQNLVIYASAGFTTIWAAILTGCALLGILAAFTRLHRAAFRGAPRPTWLITASGVLAVTGLALSPGGGEFGAIIWLAGAVVHFRLRTSIALAGAVYVAGMAAMMIQPLFFADPATLERTARQATWLGIVIPFYSMAIWTVTPAALMIGMQWMWRTTREAHEGQEAKAKLAVSEERLRFARDLHDLLGHSLSVMSLKSELAGKIAGRDPATAAAEMEEVHRLARDSLKEVRAAVRGYRAIDLDEELTSVRGVLEAAGVRCTVNADAAGLSSETRTLLAWAVREGATNVLKHSTAAHCAIIIRNGVLEIRNDGVREEADPAGSGLRGLSERLAGAGGSLSAARTDEGEFLLRAAVPV